MHTDTVSVDTAAERRASELQAFIKVTDRLSAVAAGTADRTTWRQALETNRAFWTVLKENIFRSENRLTPELKGQIFSLASWIESYTDKVLKGEAREVTPLIAVNDTVMQGLAA
jgi:flagellar biosynthesis regulator FlaF